MSRGLSWRQRLMLVSIAEQAKANGGMPVAWRAINYGPTSAEGDDDYETARVQWNIEQATRRSLRSLEQRGLVQLDRYCFRPNAEVYFMRQAHIIWDYVNPDDHVPGDARVMTGAVLTGAGKMLAAVEAKRLKSDQVGKPKRRRPARTRRRRR